MSQNGSNGNGHSEVSDRTSRAGPKQDRRIVELRSWYRERLPLRIAALEDAHHQLEGNPSEALESLRRIAHALRGSGATYGFPEITEAARILENCTDADVPAAMDPLMRTLKAVAHGGKSERTAVLIIEDDEELAHFMRTVLDALDRDLYIAHTAAQAQVIL